MTNCLWMCFMFFSQFASAADFYDEKMQELIDYARELNAQYPFTAMIVESETQKELCRGVNDASTNPVFHGEVVAINNCIAKYGRENLDWSKLTLITTAEPCPMCQGAIIWAGFGKVVFGTSIKHLIKKGWKQIDISSKKICEHSNFGGPEIIGGVLKARTNELFTDRHNENP